LSIDRVCEIRDDDGVFSESERGRLHRDLTATVGRTPLVELRQLGKDLPGRVAAKLEMRNRLAVALIDDAERRGVLAPGMTIVEATGGNTGIGLAFVAAVRGYRLLLAMPETMSRERVALLSQSAPRLSSRRGSLWATRSGVPSPSSRSSLTR
jgi:hypothetical protein